MRLMYFLPLLSTKGGQERTFIDKANWLVEKGHEIMFVTYANDGPIAYSLNEKAKHVDLACPFFHIYRLSFIHRFRAAFKLKREFRNKMEEAIAGFRPDVLVVAIPLSEFFLHDLIKVVGKIPIIIESHLAHGYEAMARGFTEKIFDLMYSPLHAICKSDLLIALTEGDANTWCKLHHHVCMIPNPLTSYPEVLPSMERQEGRILCIGRLSPQKRFDRLINAFGLIEKKYPSWHIDIYGVGQEQGLIMMNQLINNKGLKGRVKICSPVDDIYSEYQRSQFFVSSSDFEGFGLVIVEAMACGIPVVATDCPYGPSEIIDDGKTGLLAKMDEKDLAEKMEWMITHDDERKQMGYNAYQAVARYRKEEILPLWEKAYMSVIR